MMDNPQQDNSFLTFRVGPFYLAVPAVDAEAIITMPQIRSVPLTPDSVAGVFSHRSKITVVISLKQKFGLKESDDRSVGQLIISQLSTGLTAFRVDEVLDIIPGSELNFSTLPALGMLKAFDRFAVKNDEIILHTDFELLWRLKDSDELADSLKSLTNSLKPESGSDKPVPGDNISESEYRLQTTLEENADKENPVYPSSSDFSNASGKPDDNGTEKVSSQPFQMTGKRILLTSGVRSPRKAKPYKPRTVVRIPTVGQRLSPNRQAAPEQPGRYIRFAVTGILILSLILISMIWLWSGRDQDLEVVYKSEKPAVSNSQDVSTQSLDLPKKLLEDDTSKIATDDSDGPENTDGEIFKTEKPADTARLKPKTDEKIPGAVEKNNTDLPVPQEGEEVLRIETDDFTLTIERGQSQKTEPTTQIEQQPVVVDENSQILKTEKQSQLEKTDEPIPLPEAVEKMEIMHIVVKGDTLWDIAARYLGDPFRYPELAKLSRINDPDLIYPGDLIRITKKKRSVLGNNKITSEATERAEITN
jgi:chemotaxis signal transduction protein/LysM repeat protein